MRLLFNPLSLCATLFLLGSIQHAYAEEGSLEDRREHKPRIIYQPLVKYPASAVGSRVTGEVLIKLLVNEEGELEQVDVLKADPVGYGLERSAVEMSQKMSFVAPQVSGVSVRSALSLKISFTPEMLVKELQSRGLFEEAEDYKRRIENVAGGEIGQQELSVYGAHKGSTDVAGLSIHQLVDGPLEEIERTEDEPMPQVEGPTGEVEGLVLAQGTRSPIPNAVVKFSGFEVTRKTNPWGRFRFIGVPVGRLTILVNVDGYAPQSYELIVEEGAAREVRKVFMKPLSFTEREEYGHHIPPRVTTRHHLQQDELRSIAGVDSDLIKAARDLPGLYRSPFDLDGAMSTRAGGMSQWGGSSELIFRGGVEGGAYLLGTPMLTLSHLNHSRSILPTSLVGEIQVKPDYEIEYGRVGGGLLDVKLAPAPEDHRRTEIELNAYELSAVVGGPLSSNTTLTGALKVGVMRAAQQLIEADEWLTYGVQVPHTQDLHLFLTHTDGRHRFQILTGWHISGWSEDLESPDLYRPEQRGDIGQSQSGVSVRSQWSYASSKHQYNNQLSFAFEQLGYRETFSQTHSLAHNLNQLYVADRFKMRLIKPLWIRVGLEHQMSYSILTQQDATLWAEGSGRATHRAEPREEREDDFIAYSPSAWVGIEGRWTKLHLLLGTRVTYWSETDQITPEPRVTLRYTPAFGTILKLGGGLYTEQLRPRYFDRYLGVGSAQGVKLQQPQNVFSSAGWEQRFTRSLYLDLTGFYRQFSDRLAPSTDPTVRFTSDGAGNAYGGELLVRYEPDSRYYGWLSYSYTRARFTSNPNERERRGDFDQTHSLSAVAGMKITPRFRLNSRWRYQSGIPYSPLTSSTFDSDIDQLNFGIGSVNTQRFGAFHQLDLRLDYQWIFTEWSMLTYLQINNVYNQRTDEAVHPLSGVSPDAPAALTTWPIWVSVGLRATF